MARIVSALLELPIIAVESQTTSPMLISIEVAAVSPGENVAAAEQQIPLPPLRPRPAPIKRSAARTIIAN
ncbi:hypothetical protein [Bradyrhizobium sp. SZCCHNR1075]|uniref:hypothetical protein n=1 Tax=Bradyrhizobium sp. SZCCHNR1075 TaxID=3057362 RepID=UPI0028E57CD5|nr:hypothetical protein [Bradyrhizobium sp. SZCCHNR1075]